MCWFTSLDYFLHIHETECSSIMKSVQAVNCKHTQVTKTKTHQQLLVFQRLRRPGDRQEKSLLREKPVLLQLRKTQLKSPVFCLC